MIMDAIKIEKKFYERHNPGDEYLGQNKPVNRIHPVVSVLVPTYQHESFIDECLQGIVDQKTSFPFEILIGEDGSHDKTRERCIRYAEKYPDKIRLFLRDRKQSVLLNDEGKFITRFNVRWLGLDARGEFFALCEGDDYWTDPNKLEKQVEALKRHPQCKMCFHAYTWLRHTTKVNRDLYWHHKKEYIFEVDDIIRGGADFCATASIMYRKEVYEKLRSWPWIFKMPVADYFLQITGALDGGALYINQNMSVYRRNAPGSWTSRHENIVALADHQIKMLNAINLYDKKTDYRYHKSFKAKKDWLDINKTLRNLYSYDRDVIEQVKQVVNNQAKGVLKFQCYLLMFKSFLYYRFHLKKVTGLLRSLHLR